MLAARVKNREDHQVGIGEQPLFGLSTRGLRSACEKSEVLTPSKTLQVIEADAGEPGDFVRREQFLTGPNRDQGFLTQISDAADILNAAAKH